MSPVKWWLMGITKSNRFRTKKKDESPVQQHPDVQGTSSKATSGIATIDKSTARKGVVSHIVTF